MFKKCALIALVSSIHCVHGAALIAPSSVPYLEASQWDGRNYYLLQSGRMRMVVQADRATFAPAFTWMLFDAQDAKQYFTKKTAYNFGNGQGLADSSLEVNLGGIYFTAMGNNSEVHWTRVEGIPAIEAKWWAGGIQVTEQMFALKDKEAFVRRIILDPKSMGGKDHAILRLCTGQPGVGSVHDGLVWRKLAGATMAIGVIGDQASHAKATENRMIDIGPIELEPGKKVAVDTLILTHLDSQDEATHWKPAAAGGHDAAIYALDIGDAIKGTRDAWSHMSLITGGDSLLSSTYNSAAYTLRAEIGDSGAIVSGPFEYEGLWARDSSNTIVGLVHAGHFEQAKAGLDFVFGHLINDKGQTVVDDKIQAPELEELDQMGEILHALQTYYDWTGDDSLLRKYRAKILALVDLPLQPEVMDPATGMVHNRREYWERTYNDAFELAYEVFTAYGLRAAADMAGPLEVPEKADPWRAAADKMWKSTLSDPKMSLVQDGHLIKRRDVTGQISKGDRAVACDPWDPSRTEANLSLNPDSTVALPIALGLVDPQSALAKSTLEDLERIWNERWFTGGYGRYETTSEVCQIGPWPISTAAIMRAQQDAGMYERSRRSLEWLAKVGPSGAYPEATPSLRQVPVSGIIVWGTGEIPLFAVRHVLGIRFEGHDLVLKPAPYPGQGELQADLRYRNARLKLSIPGPGPYSYAKVNGTRIEPAKNGAFHIPSNFAGGSIIFYAH